MENTTTQDGFGREVDVARPGQQGRCGARARADGGSDAGALGPIGTLEKFAEHDLLERLGAGLKDQRPTPLNPVAAGVEVHAQALEQIILGDFLERPELAEGAEIVYLVVLGLILIFLLPWVGVVWCAIIGGGRWSLRPAAVFRRAR